MIRNFLGLTLLLATGSAQALSCGDTVSTSITLSADLHCTTGYTALHVATPGITIDLNGHTLSGTSALQGIDLEAGLVTVKNGTIRGFWGGIVGLRAHKLHVDGVTFSDMGVALALNHTADTLIENNRFLDIEGQAISLDVPTIGWGSAGYHVIRKNYFEKVYTGIDVCGYPNRGLQILDNEITSVRDYAIHASEGSGAHRIAGNTISDVENTGIVLRASSDNEISGNVIRKGRLGLALIPELSGHCVTGPVLDPYVSGNLVDGNTIIEQEGGLALGLGLSSKGLVFKNDIHFNKIYDNDTGIYFQTDAHDNDATGNAYSGTATPVVDSGVGNVY